MVADQDWSNLLSPFLSGTLGATLARWLFSKTVKELSELPSEISELKEAIIAIKGKLEILEEIRDLVYQHDKDIAVLEVTTRGCKHRTVPDGKGRKVPN